MWRGEVRVVFVPASIRLLWVSPERILVLGADGVGRAGWIQELFVVAKDDVEEEGGEAEFDEEGENVRPSASVPCTIAPCTERRGQWEPRFVEGAHILQRRPRLAWYD